MKRLRARTHDYTVVSLCRLFGIHSKQAFYQHKDEFQLRVIKERFAMEWVKEIRTLDGGLGGEKLWLMYKTYFGSTYCFGRDSFAALLRRNGLTIRQRRKAPRTTNSDHDLPTYPNLIKELRILRPMQVWVSDITYIKMRNDKFCFLSLLTDAYHKEIMGYSVGKDLSTLYPLNALKQAVKKIAESKELKLIHHSDRGVQYASFAYTDYLKANGISISMTENGDPKENAIAERVNGIIKTEFLADKQFDTIEQVRKAVDIAVEFYNTRRPHQSLNMMTPIQASQCTGELKKHHWISYAEKYRKQETNVVTI